jgi:hypothetical protein
MKKLIHTALAVLVGVAIGYGVASFKTAPAVAYAQATSYPAMCSNGGSVPGGYVVVGESNTSNCVSPVDNSTGYMLQIEKPKANANGTMGDVICTGTPVPGGYVTTGWNHNDHVCAIPGAPQLNQQSIALYN